MSCVVMKCELLAALANAVEARLNCNYNFWGFEAPHSLYTALDDCRTVPLYAAEKIYRKLYVLNVQAYNERYKSRKEPLSEEIPVVVVSAYTVHHKPEYRNHGFAVRPWHYHLALLLNSWLYHTLEGAVKDHPLRLAMRDFRDCLYGFIVQNSPPYTAVRWGDLPPVGKREAVYYINTIPGEAAAQKGHADFPEDFPHLRPGEDFTVWRVGRGWEVETTLGGETLFARLNAIEAQESSEQSPELQYIISFAEESRFDMEPAHSQLRSLWTAYCLHHDLNVDTSGYDHDLMAIWEQVSATEGNTACWSDFESFDAFMSADLV